MNSSSGLGHGLSDHDPSQAGHGPFTSHVDSGFTPSSPAFSLKSQRSTASVADVASLLKQADHKKVKSLLRSNHWSANHEVRSLLWLRLCEWLFKPRSDADAYKLMINEVFGQGISEHDVTLPSFVNPDTMWRYHLSDTGVHAAKRILCVLGVECPQVTFAPTVFPICCLFLHYLTESATYICLGEMLRSKTAYLVQTKSGMQTSVHVLKDLSRKYAKNWHNFILSKGFNIESVLGHWTTWLLHDLPFPYLVRVIDCYLYEGPKIFYRVTLALLNQFIKSKVHLSGSKEGNLTADMSQFCEDISDTISPEKLLASAFGIRGLSRKEIRKSTLKAEMYVCSTRNINIPSSTMKTSTSCDSLNMQVSRSFSGPVALDDVPSSMLTPREREGVSRGRSSSQGGIRDILPFNQSQSTVISMTDWHQVWSWLPMAITLYQPQLVYTTSEHGTSLMTFYQYVEGRGPTLLLIKTTAGQVFGAYCATDWETRHRKENKAGYFGTGETFIFRFHPKQERFPWVGIKLREKTDSTSSYFQAGTKTSLMIGGGGGNSLWLDQTVDKGRSQRSKTFDNPPLVEGEDFTCQILEAFVFVNG